MRKATRQLLNIRPTAAVKSVSRRLHSDSKVGHCYKNARAECHRSGGTIVPGWIITPTFSDLSNGVMFHFWNCDSAGKHYDTTDIDSDYEYVEDPSVWWHSIEWSKANTAITNDDVWFPPALKFKGKDVYIRLGDRKNTKWQFLLVKEQAMTIVQMMDLAYGPQFSQMLVN